MTTREALLETASDATQALASIARPALFLGGLVALFLVPLFLLARSAGAL